MGAHRGWQMPLGAQSVLTQASWTGVRVMAGYRALEEGGGPWFLALLTAAFAVPALAAAVPAGRITDRAGGSAMAMSGAMVSAGGIALVMLLPGLPWLLGACAVIGLGNLMAMVGQQTFVAQASRGGPTEGAFGYLSATASAGQAIGPPAVTTAAALVMGVGSSLNTNLGMAVCLFFTLAASLFFWPMRSKETQLGFRNRPPVTTSPTESRSLFPRVWKALVVSGLVLVTLDLLYTFLPLWALEGNVDATVVGLLLALRAVVSMLGRLGLGRLVQKCGRPLLLSLSTATAALGLAVLPFLDAGGAAAVMILLGIGLGIPQPLTMSWAVDLTGASRHGTVLGMRLSANRLAQILVPLGVGVLAVPLGAQAVFFANAGLMVACSALCLSKQAPDATQ